jgi:hypothetical protein
VQDDRGEAGWQDRHGGVSWRDTPAITAGLPATQSRRKWPKSS